MNSFTAIDFETANGYGYAICQIGLVRIENGIIVNEISILVQPPDNFYWDNLKPRNKSSILLKHKKQYCIKYD